MFTTSFWISNFFNKGEIKFSSVLPWNYNSFMLLHCKVNHLGLKTYDKLLINYDKESK